MRRGGIKNEPRQVMSKNADRRNRTILLEKDIQSAVDADDRQAQADGIPTCWFGLNLRIEIPAVAIPRRAFDTLLRDPLGPRYV